MDKHKFLNLLNNPSSLEESVNELKEVIKKYPYSPLPYILLAKHYFHKDGLEKDLYLQLAAAHVSDRQILRDYIYGVRDIAKKVPSINEAFIIDQAEGVHSISHEETISEIPASPLEEGKNYHTSPALIIEEPLHTNGNNGSHYEMVEEEILSSTISEQEIKDLEEIQHPNIAPSEEFLKKEIDQESNEDPSVLLEYLNKVRAEKEVVQPEYKNEQDEIIERFIKTQPTISKMALPVHEEDMDDLSEESTSFDANLVSENLAVIMARQGKVEKAIDIYKKLIWKYPQKKVYFANRIEELKNS